jgi:predicted Zn-dependent protease
MNAPTQVGGASPDQDAVAVLEIVAEGDDPTETAEAIARERGLDADKLTHGLTINGLPAVRSRRVTGRNGRHQVTLEATWIAFDHNIYQVVCLTTPDKVEAYHSDFLRIPHSFRAATDDDRARVKVRRLRTRKARAGETVAQLVERTGSTWNADIVAIANGIETDTPPAAGTPIKVAIEEPYRPK